MALVAALIAIFFLGPIEGFYVRFLDEAKELHAKRNKRIQEIREREPMGSNHRGDD